MIAVSLTPHPIEAALEAAHAEERDASVSRWLQFAHIRPGDVVELQALNVVFGNSQRTYVAHASTKTAMLRLLDEAKRYECPGIYVVANRVDPAVATRLGIDKWNAAPKGTSTTDRDILCRTVLFIDVDAERPRGTSATAIELAASVEVATRIFDWLARALRGTSALGYGASGNGRGIYVALDDLVESDAATRIKAILVGLERLFSTATAKVDVSVSDAKRLVPAFGTVKKKGAAGVVDRPHRRTAFFCEEAVTRVGVAELDVILDALRFQLDEAGSAVVHKALGMKPAPKSTTAPRSEADSPFSRANALDVTDVLSWVGAIEGDRPRCPGCGESDQGVVVINNGLKCSHARCASKGVRDGFRTPVDLVCEAKLVEPREAVNLMAAQFGFEGLRAASSPARAPSRPAKVVVLSTPADRVRALAQLGPVTRLESGLPTLDHSCRGGVPTRRLVVVGGAPGAGKTTLATNLLWKWAKAGVPAAMLAVDEDADGILMRIAQLEGIDAERIEERDPISLNRLATMVDAAPLILVDGDDAAGSVEAVAELLAARAGGREAVLVVDSIQTARAAGTEDAGSPRERIDCVIRAMKTARDRHGLLVIATCELARGSYRSKNAADQINDLAAFKESGGIEYAAQTALVLRSVPNESDLVDVAVPKNRAYRKEPFRLRLDHRTTELVEVELPPDAIPQDESARYAGVRRAVVDVVGAQELRSARSILRAVRGLGQRCRDADVYDAVRVMQDEGVLRRDGREPFRIDVPHHEGQE
jgi:KaiC/GvpD/RAD55 family RecA-like ATPase